MRLNRTILKIKNILKKNWRVPKLGVVIFCLTVLVLAITYNIVGDRTVWGAWISVVPSIIWVVLLLPTAIRLRRWLLGAFLAGFLLLTTEWPRVGGATVEPEDTLRLISWNIGAGNTNWVESLKGYAPDIVLVQESVKPLEIWDGFRWHGSLDPGVLTRFSVEVLPTRKVGPWTEPQLLLMEIRGKRVLVANVRLMLPSVAMQLLDPLGEEPLDNYRARIRQYEKLAKLVKETAQRTQTDSIILAGDFNVPARMPSLAPFRDFLRDGWLAAGWGWGPTAPAFLPLSRVDQVWVSNDVELVSVRVLPLAGSDHRGLIVDFLL